MYLNKSIPLYLNESIPFQKDDTVTICETKEVVNGTPVIEYGGMTPLYNGNKDCLHEIVGGDSYSGIKCRKCNGWYCA